MDWQDCVVSRECWCQSDYVSVDCGDRGRWFWPLSESIRQTQEEESITWIIPLRRYRAKLLLSNIGSVPGLLCSIISIICSPAFQPDKLPGSSQIVSKLYSSVHTQNIKLTLREGSMLNVGSTFEFLNQGYSYIRYKNIPRSITNSHCNIWILNLPEKRRWQGRAWPSWRTTQRHNNNSICQNWCRHQSVPVSHCAGSILPTFPPTIITSPLDCTDVTQHFRSRDSNIMAFIVPRLQTPEFMEFNRNDQTEHEMCFYTIIYWRGPRRYFVLGVVWGLFSWGWGWWEPGSIRVIGQQRLIWWYFPHNAGTIADVRTPALRGTGIRIQFLVGLHLSTSSSLLTGPAGLKAPTLSAARAVWLTVPGGGGTPQHQNNKLQHQL